MITSQAQLGSGEFGFSFNPVHYVKAAAHDVRHPLDTAKGAAQSVGHAIKTGIIKPFEWIGSKVTAPIRNRVHTLRNRRAAKLAWDKRKSKTPNATENAEAKAWTKNHLKKQGPHGEVLQLFAGAPSYQIGYGLGYAMQLGDPATITLIAASIPVFMALMNSVLKKANSSGEAPANPGADAAAVASSGTATAAQDATAAAAAADGGGDAGGGDGADTGGDDSAGGGGGKGGGAMVKLPGGVKMKRKTLMIGGAVAGGLILVALLTSPKKS